ncbi:MAG: DUF5702 domain-containing protein [Acetivibrio sp.]
MKKRKTGGEITVFLTLMLLILLSFFSTAIQSAVQVVQKTYCERDLRLCTQSLFTQYARPLWEKYHLFMLEGEEASYIKNRMEDYGGNISGPFFREENSQIRVEKITNFLDKDGSIYLEEIKAYMKYHGAKEGLESANMDVEDMEKARNTRNLLEKKNELDEKLGQLDRSVLEAIRLIEGIEIRDGKIETSSTFIKQMVSGEINAISVGLNNSIIWEALKGKYLHSKACDIHTCQRLKRTIHSALKEIDKIEEKQKMLQGEVEEYKDYFEEKKPKVLEEVRETLSHDLSRIDSYTKKQNTEQSLSQQLIQMKGVLENNAEILEIYEKHHMEKDAMEILAAYQVQCLQFDYGALEIQGKESPLSKLKKEVGNGILQMTLENPSIIGEKPYPPAFPFEEKKQEELLKKGISTALEIAYYQMHFSNFSTEKGEGGEEISCEQEQIAAGGNSEKEALENYLSQLLIERTTYNFLYLVQDGEKSREAYLAALGLVGFSCMEPLIQTAKYSILMGWAAAEGMVDLAILLKGGKIARWKTSCTFLISFQELFIFGKDFIQEKAKEGLCQEASGGKSYEEYLKGMLLLQKSQIRLGRSLKIIERNMKESYVEDFSISKGIFGIAVKEEITLKNGNCVESTISYSY